MTAGETGFIVTKPESTGAVGYVPKQVRGSDLVRAIRAVGGSESLLAPAMTKRVLDRLGKGKHLLMDKRLARALREEERILNLVAEGRTNHEIGDKLHPADRTVKNYVSSILSKLEVARRAGAADCLGFCPTTPPVSSD